MLLRGLIDGNAQKERKIKIIKDGDNQKTWKASEVFEQPLLTIDGETFYCKLNEKNKPNTYGACFSDQIPESYVQKKVSSKEKENLKTAFYVNQRLIKSREAKNEEISKSKEEKIKAESEIHLKSEDKLSRVFQIAKALIGLTLLVNAGVSITGSIVTGATAPIIIVPATITAIIALLAIYSGSSNALKLSNKINKYELEDKLGKQEELIKTKAQDERTKIFREESKQTELKNQIITQNSQRVKQTFIDIIFHSRKNAEKTKSA